MGFDACGFTLMEKPTSEQCVHADEVICELFCEFKWLYVYVSYHIGIILVDVFKHIIFHDRMTKIAKPEKYA